MSKQSGHSHDLSLPADQVPQVGELVAGKYRIEGRLGAGGMGVVLAARHEAIGQRVAIKFLTVGDEHFREEAIQRLMREARAAAALRGDHVVRVYDVGELPDGAPFIVMEHLEGKDLAEVMQRVGRLPVPEATALVAQAANAVGEAHRAGIVHRDLKPSNLFVVRRPDGSASIKVLDFGIAKSADPQEPLMLTGARAVLGTAHYMSPEQIRDSHSVDARSDVWALGAILYELVAGRPAFQASTHSGVYAAIVADTPPPLSSLRPGTPPALEQLLSDCLERDPAKRVQSAEALATSLGPFAARAVDFDHLLESSSPAPMLDDYVLAAQRRSNLVEPTLPAAVAEARPLEERSREVKSETASAPNTQVSFGASSVVPSAQPGEAAISGFKRTQRSSLPAPERGSAVVRRALIATSIFAAFGLSIVGLRSLRDAPKSLEPAAVLTIESQPSGARVREGAHLLGTTPLQIPLPASSGSAKVRIFALELAGYRPYFLEQGPADGAVLARVQLTSETAAPPPSASPAPEPSAPAASAAAPAASRPGQRATPASATTSVGNEIRLSR